MRHTLNGHFAYVRVSTVRQGEKGSSLQEQKDAIEAYARRHSLRIAQWFEEKETAAKQGRPIFAAMLKQVGAGKAAGIIIHKIDRSARNLRDWAMLGELIDRGTEIHFAHESIDFHSRGGRLAADMLAVVAADYVRNLRDEVKKGFYGRLKQGFYPLKAPIGYLDNGGGRLKTTDPLRAPLVIKAFELYATGCWSLNTLVTELGTRGLRTSGGRPLTRNGLSTMLNNTFYVGLISIARAGEVYQGKHAPLIDKSLFDRVQAVLQGRTSHKASVHKFRYQRMLLCAVCGRSLVASRHKGHVYYRCQTIACPTTCVREDMIDDALRASASKLQFTKAQWAAVASDIETVLADRKSSIATDLQAIDGAILTCTERLDRLTDAYIDRMIDHECYANRKESLLEERAALMARKGPLAAGDDGFSDQIAKILELTKALGLLPQTADDAFRREILRITTSNLVVAGKDVTIAWQSPFRELLNEPSVTAGGPRKGRPRTSSEKLQRFIHDLVRDSKSLVDLSGVNVPELGHANDNHKCEAA